MEWLDREEPISSISAGSQAIHAFGAGDLA